MSRITDYPQIPLVDPADVLPIVDVDDTTSSPAGTTKAVTVARLVAAVAPPSPMTNRGDMIFESAGLQPTRLPGNTAATRKFLREQGDGTNALDPAWDTLQQGDIPQLNQYNPIGLTGATTPTSYAGGTTRGHPLTGTWTQGQWVMSLDNHIYVCVAGGSPGTWRRADADPWMFFVDDYGAAPDGAYLYDAQMSVNSAVLTTSGLPAPAAPALSQAGSGGSITGTFQAKITYVNAFGETLASASSSITCNGATSLTIASPPVWTNAVSWYAYVTGPGGSVFYRQQAAGSPSALGVALIITAPPTLTGAQPSASNTSASSPFTAADVGKAIVVPSALTGGLPLCTTIGSVQGPGQVTLAAPATAAVAQGSGACYGTDNTTFIQAAINAAVAYALANPAASVNVLFSVGFYCIAGAPGPVAVPAGWAPGSVGGNAQIGIPFISDKAGPKVDLGLLGPTASTPPTHWNQPNPAANGAVLVSMRGDGSFSSGKGPACVLGGAAWNVGGPNGLFSNMRVRVDGLTVLTPYPSTYAGLDLYGVGQASHGSFSAMQMAVSTAQPLQGWPQYANGVGNHSQWETFAYRTPTLGNNDQNDIQHLVSYGYYHTALFTDHFNAENITGIFGLATATAVGLGGGGSAHHCRIGSLSSEATSIALYAPTTGLWGSAGGSVGITVESMHLENADYIIRDDGNQFYGEAHAEMLGLLAPFSGVGSGAANMLLVWDFARLGPVAAWTTDPPMAGSGTAYKNTFWHNAIVIVTGGTVTGISLDGKPTGLTSGPVFVRNGGTITITYTGSTPPTWTWLLA